MTAPERLDCHDVAKRLYEYLDSELTAENEAAVRGHLAECEGCFSLYHFERAYLRFLSARAGARAVPQHLRKRIFEQLLFDEDGGEPT